MAWLDQTDLENAISSADLIALTDDTGAGAVNTTIMDAAIAQAKAYLKTKVWSRYSNDANSETESEVITEIMLCLTVRNLINRRFQFSVPEEWGGRLEKAFDLLDEIGRGDVDVPEWSESTDAIVVGEMEWPEDGEDYYSEIDDWQKNRTEFNY